MTATSLRSRARTRTAIRDTRPMNVLFTWVGAHDPTWQLPPPNNRTPVEGPIVTALRGAPALLGDHGFDRVYLLLTPGVADQDFAARATSLLRLCAREMPRLELRQRPVELASPVAYEEIYRAVNHELKRIAAEDGLTQRTSRSWVLLSPGTPQMQMTWVLLVRSGLFKARMMEATPPRFRRPTAAPVREVKLQLADYPRIMTPEEAHRELGVLQERSRNLASECDILRADLASLRRSGKSSSSVETLAPMNLPAHLLEQEKAFYLRALGQSKNATEAAALLGLSSGTFRARAAALGIRDRKRRSDNDDAAPPTRGTGRGKHAR